MRAQFFILLYTVKKGIFFVYFVYASTRSLAVMMPTILFSFMTGSARAEKCVQIAKMNNSEVIIVHVFHPYMHLTIAPGPMDIGGQYQVETEDEVKAVGKEIITKTQKVFDDASVKSSTRFLKGNVAEAIINEAINEEVDIIVVGATGHGGLMTWLLGSVAHKIARNAPCPVLIVR